jgi:histidinol-phosphate/aromatic aminotransferase/cobyric acid decarboxylase-like protein
VGFGITGHYLRISVGTDGQIDRLLSALSDILGNT